MLSSASGSLSDAPEQLCGAQLVQMEEKKLPYSTSDMPELCLCCVVLVSYSPSCNPTLISYLSLVEVRQGRAGGQAGV